MSDHERTRPLESESAPTPERIGPYKILGVLGEGGMGLVYLAEQETPLRRRAALKVIKAGMDSKQVVARFEVERQALALMDHPAIAKVFDAGETAQGRPYFAMEHVPGVPITEHCDRHRLDMRERLELFVQVCDGVQHAHQKAIIHRDLKPSNVLVSTQPGPVTPKIIDFGVAKALAQPLTERTLFTELGQLIGTPAYMSPEQAEMTGENIDTRTDVYSLGAMLYELLVGTAPFDTEQLRQAGLDGIRRTIREIEPPRPSTRVSSLGARSGESARNRRTAPKSLAGQLRGDLDWITMKALEKDPARRYQSAHELARDIQRHLQDEPVEAGPPSGAYRFRKFLARHRTAAAFVTTLFVLLAGFGIWMGLLYGREEALRQTAERAREEATARADELELVTDFQASMLWGFDYEAMGQDLFTDLRNALRGALQNEGTSPKEVETTLTSFETHLDRINSTNVAVGLLDRQLLRRAVEAVREEFADQPLVRAALQQTLAYSYREMGLYEQAVPLQEEALEIRRTRLGGDDPQTLSSITFMGNLLQSMGRLEDAAGYYREALERRRRVLGDHHQDTLLSINDLGTLFWQMGATDEALEHFGEALEGSRTLLGDDHPETLTVMENMALVLETVGRFDEALEYAQQALAGSRRALGDDHRDTLISINNMGSLLQSMGRYEEAREYYQEALAGRRRVLGDDHQDTLISINNLGHLLKTMGQLDEALEHYREALEGMQRVLGEDHPNTLTATMNMGGLHWSRKELAQAEEYYRQAWEGCRRVLGPEHPTTLSLTATLGRLLLSRERPDEAVALLSAEEARVRRALAGNDARRLGDFLAALGRAQTEIGAFSAAESYLLEANALLQTTPQPTRARNYALTGLVELYESWHATAPDQGYDAQANRWRTEQDGLRESQQDG